MSGWPGLDDLLSITDVYVLSYNYYLLFVLVTTTEFCIQFGTMMRRVLRRYRGVGQVPIQIGIVPDVIQY